MKKSLLFILSFLFCVSCFARKSYINVYVTGYLSHSNYQTIVLTGDVPVGIKSEYSSNDNVTIGKLLNMLSQEGYEVGFMSDDGQYRMNYLLSKNSSSNEDDDITIVHNDDGDVREVARYNLQGMPVNENTPGIQIIVFSNYTTKTVIVE